MSSEAESDCVVKLSCVTECKVNKQTKINKCLQANRERGKDNRLELVIYLLVFIYSFYVLTNQSGW